MEFVIISGMSGAGKQVRQNMEDIGYHCVGQYPHPAFADTNLQDSSTKQMKKSCSCG